MSLSRRRFLGLTGAAAGVAGAAALGGLSGCGILGIGTLPGQTGALVRSRIRLPKPFQVPLPIPPVARRTRTDGAGDHYEIVQKVANAEIVPGLRTPIFGYDGVFPGPTFEARSGRTVVVHQRNELPLPAVVHLHGGHTPAASDGFATDLILPRGGWHPRPGRMAGGSHADPGAMLASGRITTGSRDYTYPLQQRASTLWYHDHRMDFTGPQVYRGLAGFFLVRDDEEERLGLPEGDREVPLMICDRSFEADGSFRYPAVDRTLQSTPGVREDFMAGVLGDVVLVNGAPWPVMEVDTARYRFRILNASNARRYDLRLAAGSRSLPMTQIGSDAGLLAAPVRRTGVTIAPAERFDVVVDFTGLAPGTLVTMTNAIGEDERKNVMAFRVHRRVHDTARVPAQLSRIERLDPAKAVRTRTWQFQRGDVGDAKGWLINNRSFDPKRMDADPKLGELEIWRFASDVHHPVHVHLDPFQVVRRGAGGAGSFDTGWKDTVDIRPGETVEVAVRFTDYAGAYLLHCHNLEHEDMAMMAAFATR